MANHGGDPDTRWALLQDRVEAMKAIWTQDEATYHGRFVNFDAIWSWPKPVQQPHPPILLAGNGPRVIDRVLAYADGWAPLPFPGLPARIAELQSLAKEAGREVSVTVYGLGAPPDPADLVMYAEAGVERCVYHLPPGGGGRERTPDRSDPGRDQRGRSRRLSAAELTGPRGDRCTRCCDSEEQTSASDTKSCIVHTPSLR